MRTRFLLLLILVAGVAVQYTNAAEDDDNIIVTPFEGYEYDFNWLSAPPEEAAEVPVWISYLSYDEKIHLRRHSLDDNILVKDDSVYLPIMSLRVPTYRFNMSLPGGYESHKGWIKGVVEGDKIVFKRETGMVDVTRYTVNKEMTEEWTEDGVIYSYHSFDTIANDNYRVELWSASDFSKEHYRSESYVWSNSVEFKPFNSDVVGRYDPITHTISNLNAGLVISPEEISKISAGFADLGGSEPVLKQVIPGLIVGQLSDIEPTLLPKPEVATRIEKSGGHYHGGFDWRSEYCYMDVRLDLVNEDGKLLDPERIYIRSWVDGEQKEDLPFSVYGNPFGLPANYKVALYGWSHSSYDEGEEPPSIDDYDPSIKVMCYLLKEDGTTVDSPCYYRNYPESIGEIGDDHSPSGSLVEDGKVYDLTGREVNPDRLSPGIYIRNGRKFAVTSR